MRLVAALWAMLALAGCATTPLSTLGLSNEQLLSIKFDPSNQNSPTLAARVCLPSGAGPFRVALLTHGSASSPALRNQMQPAECDSPPMRWFTSQNYAAVSLMRRGFGASTGPALEDNGPCVAPDYLRSAVLGGEDIRAVLREVSTQPWAKRTGAVVVGQSTGGWAGLGVAALNDPRIRAVIAFAPGRGAKAYAPPDSVCRPDLLVSAARELGAQKTTPVLWILALNDSYFPPEISEALHQAFIEGGGRAELVEINPFFDEGHALYNAPGGSDVWGPVVQDFLSRSP